MKIKFSSADTQLLRYLLRQITAPARKHRCIECKEIFECHICNIGEEHSAHWKHGSFLCEDCANKLQIPTIFCQDSRHDRWTEYNYTTGDIIRRYGFIYKRSSSYHHRSLGFRRVKSLPKLRKSGWPD